MKISVVSPVYYGEKLVPELVNRLHQSLSAIHPEYEIILVEDGSPDQSWKVIREICSKDPKAKGLKLSRNFGQHYAITAGLQAASGEWIVVMDCDLQDRPEEIPRLFEKCQEGFDIVYAQRKLRQDSFLKRLSSRIFYRVFGYLTDTKQDASIANFGIYHQQVIQAVLSMNDYIRYFPTMVQWVGFDSAKIDVEHSERMEGKSSYSWKSLIKLASKNIIAFSDKPLRLTVKFGFGMSVISFLIGVVYLYRYFTGQIQVMGFTSIIISTTFLSGLIILTLGIIGIYLGKTFEQSKQRPNFIVHQKLNLDE
ncbi:MAG: glycosyltransferase [Bacteroidetes bacterium]|nr:MAG: glycosyltransferase [Bacteroidota bacterium]